MGKGVKGEYIGHKTSRKERAREPPQREEEGYKGGTRGRKKGPTERKGRRREKTVHRRKSKTSVRRSTKRREEKRKGNGWRIEKWKKGKLLCQEREFRKESTIDKGTKKENDARKRRKVTTLKKGKKGKGKEERGEQKRKTKGRKKKKTTRVTGRVITTKRLLPPEGDCSSRNRNR